MAGNIATLVPITKGDPRGGRRPGQVNLTTKVLKRAILLAGARSEHAGEDQTLLSYVTWLANAKPELYVSLLIRLVPVEAKLKTDFERPQRLTSDMPLAEMIQNFERKLKDPSYFAPSRTIEHTDGDDDDGDDE